jgi:hypothetical protein
VGVLVDWLSAHIPRHRYPAISELLALKGADLKAQLDKWAAAGTIEPSARDAIQRVAEHPAWLDLSDEWLPEKYYYFFCSLSNACVGLCCWAPVRRWARTRF